jgi:putative lipoprotein
MRGLRQILAAIVAASVSVACSDGPVSDGPASVRPAADELPAHLASITGTISYRERLALTSLAEAVVTLEDASLQDAPAIRLAQQIISDPGQIPIRFALDYPRAAIDPRGRYILRAQITDRGGLLFTTDSHTPVLTRGAGDEIHLLLVPVAGNSGSPAVIEAAPAAGSLYAVY